MPAEKLKIYLHGSKIKPGPIYELTFWCRNYFFYILAHPVYKM